MRLVSFVAEATEIAPVAHTTCSNGATHVWPWTGRMLATGFFIGMTLFNHFLHMVAMSKEALIKHGQFLWIILRFCVPVGPIFCLCTSSNKMNAARGNRASSARFMLIENLRQRSIWI